METVDRFPLCLPFTLKEEGGNSNDRHDPGGRTSRGITQRELNAWRHLKGLPIVDVFTISDAEVADIYRAQYWLPYCPTLAAGVDLSFFDNAVNEGPAEATKVLQGALGVPADGHFGIVTESALKTVDTARLINGMADKRLGFYRHLSIFKYFGVDWTRREENCRRASLAMAAAAAAPQVTA